MRRTIIVLGFIGLLACEGMPLDDGFDGGPAFRISGEVAPGVVVTGTGTRGAVAYAWSSGGASGVMVVETALEQRIWAYALPIPPPPPPEGTLGAVPDLQATDALSVLIGLPFLYEVGPTGETPRFTVDGTQLLARANGGAAIPVHADGGARVAAFAESHLIGLYAGDAPELGADPGFTGACALDGVRPGLTLYRDDGGDCRRYRALAEPGERLEFQGVRMIAP